MLRTIIRTFTINSNYNFYRSIKLPNSSIFLQKRFQNLYIANKSQEENVHINLNSNRFTYRTYNCEQLRLQNVGEKVTLCGWLEYQRMNKFLVIRDGYGHTQLIIPDKNEELQRLIKSLPYESIIEVYGTVLSRPRDMINSKQTTGEIEVLIESLAVLNRACDDLPFNLREFQKAKEALRMKYRYIDLRFPEMQRNLRFRSKFIMDVSNFLVNECSFVNVETPTLFKKTPGGAQEFIVPTRFPGEFYSLVQSPQQFKQMLMAGGIDRYFQIAHCYRDEGSRSDRQPEFAQLDIEMSFTNVEGVTGLIEEMLQLCWPSFLKPLPKTFSKLSYKEAIEMYGTDKPDTSFDFTIKNCTDILKKNTNLYSTVDFGAYYLIFKNPYNRLPKSVKNQLNLLTENYSETKFIQSNIINAAEWTTKMSNLLGSNIAAELQSNIPITDNSVVFLALGNRSHVLQLLGAVRLEYIKFLESEGHKIKDGCVHPLWVIDFPLFEEGIEPGTLQSAHHPFTAPHPDDAHLLEISPKKVRALAYDLVLNGHEIAGGSIRIHNRKEQEFILQLLNIDKSLLQHHLDMLESGCPPHGGIAIGLDRLLAVMLNTQSIRDVIAFPKTFEGRDPITSAPSPITDHDKKLYHLEVATKSRL
ncbi:hypothetical protein RN001_008666 [Aquatica leii]|uniref:Aminoacyl-transfer RNA synthetases class-II family profile domain-containing protein n=1 Tax=Aquatica leii TaxID=1421715 RepID=A0AAN7Q5B3_9COLE|nr:hypothetical protein RN001_008666 [Aquatica leii]